MNQRLDQLELNTPITEQKWGQEGTAVSWQGAQTSLTAIWPALVHALGGCERHWDSVQEFLGLAQTAANLVLQAADCVSRTPAASTTPAAGSGSAGSPTANPLDVVESTALSIRETVRFAARQALGAAGVACCHRLSERPEWACAWLRTQRDLVTALRLAASPERIPLLPLWACLKGVPGIRSPSPEVRLAAIQLLGAAVLQQQGQEAQQQGQEAQQQGQEAQQQGPHPRQPTSGDVRAWAVCQELTCCVVAADSDPRVVAAALSTSEQLLPLCHSQCSSRDWRRLATGVLQAASRAGEQEVWAAALAFAHAQASQPGWQQAVQELRGQFLSAAAASEGPLDVHGAPAACCAVAGAAALEAGLRQPAGGPSARTQAGGPGPGCSLSVGLEVAAAAAACVSDALRCSAGAAGGGGGDVEEGGPPTDSCDGGVLSPDGGATAAWQSFLAGASLDVAGGARTAATCRKNPTERHPEAGPEPDGGGTQAPPAVVDEGEGAAGPVVVAARLQGGKVVVRGLPEEAFREDGEAEDPGGVPGVLAAAAQAACWNVGLLLGPAGGLEVLEALIGRAETAPLVHKLRGHAGAKEDQGSGSGTAAFVANRTGWLAAAGAVASGAAGSLRRGMATTAATAADGTSAVAGSAPSKASQLALAVRLARLMQRVAVLLQDPDKLLFSEVGGSPAAPPASGPTAVAAWQHHLAVAAGARLLTTLLGALPAPDLTVRPRGAAWEGGGPPAEDKAEAGLSGAPSGEETGPPRDGGARSRRPQVGIQELPCSPTEAAQPGPSPERRAASEWEQEQQALVPELLLLCATYASPSAAITEALAEQQHPCVAGLRPGPTSDTAPLTAAGSGGGVRAAAAGPGPGPGPGPSTRAGANAAAYDPGLPPPPADVFTPWADVHGAAAACGGLFAALCGRTRPHPAPSRALRISAGGGGGGGSGSLALLSAAEVSEQDLVAACLPALLYDRIRPVVVQKHVQDLEEGPIRPYTGPDVFTRAVAARRLAWLLMRSRHPFVGEALRSALPAVLACCDDPSPGVAQYGIAMLHAVAVECMAADLQWQRELLLEEARRLVVGCREQLWPLACPAAVALVRRVEGKDPRAAGYHRLTQDLLTEAERQAHVPARRLVFMPACACLVWGLGLAAVRYLSRLMPLLLEWLYAHDVRSRIAALRLLSVVVRATWPRVPAHATALWEHMLRVLVRAAAGGGAGETGEAGGSVGRLGRAGGSAEAGAAEAARLVGDMEKGRAEVGDGVGAEARGVRDVCELLLACAHEQVAAFQPMTADLPAEAARLHTRLLQV